MPTEPPAHGFLDASPAVPEGNDAAKRALWLVASGVLVVWALHNGFVYPWEERSIGVAWRDPLGIALRVLTWLVLPLAVYLPRHDPRPRLEALGVTTRVSPRGLAKSALIAAVYLTAIGLLLRAIAPPEARRGLGETVAQLSFIYMVLKSALEELLMRGFLLGQLVRFTSSFRAQAVVAVLFALMHLPSWLAVRDLGVELVPSTIAVLLLGIVLGVVARASNNIAPAIVLHVANNLLADMLGGG